MNNNEVFIFSNFFFFLCLLLTVKICTADPLPQKPLYQIDFTQTQGDSRAWLSQQQFTLKKDMREKGKLQLTSTKEKGLHISTQEAAFGIAAKKDISLNQVDRVVIEWGVEQYPAQASWEKQINREALMVTLFFGPKVRADHFYLPDLPYFIGLFLCQNDKIHIPYQGKSYQETSRYICLDSPATGHSIQSEFQISDVYKEWFTATTVPPLTGIAIEADTSDLDNGEAAAFLKRISFYGQPQAQVVP